MQAPTWEWTKRANRRLAAHGRPYRLEFIARKFSFVVRVFAAPEVERRIGWRYIMRREGD